MSAPVVLPSSTARRGLDVTTRGLVVIYRSEGHDVAALSGVDLRVAAGEVVGLLGPSGAGKSTLLTVFGGLVEPSAGKVHVGHHDVKAMGPEQLDAYRAGDVGLVLQGAGRNLLPYLTPHQNVGFAQGAARRLGRSVPDVDDVLGLLGVRALADRPLGSLSPGQLQLCAIAVGIACFPGLLLGDEPTSQLDHASRDRVLEALHVVNTQVGSTVVVVTHDPDVAARLPRTVTIRDGRVGAEGRLGEEYAVVSADGSLPLSGPALDDFPPGSLVRVRHDGTSWVLEGEQASSSDAAAGASDDAPTAGAAWSSESGEVGT
ncbi:ABC transporter ATP-binding protein [Terrabacter sp. Ter38]|uniref:ABC transporter ATP-binding protein n=1 Tax=Terrabacter sp. Ter38 TaxID=2926030 RepID=UPI002117CCAA|nr:ATP-binding cassette domain-containing protein [Terrabacter sp. Ter38]